MQNVQLEGLLSRENAPVQVKTTSLTQSRRALGSLAITEINVIFLKFSNNIAKAKARGTEDFPGQFLLPSRANVQLPSDVLEALAGWFSFAYERPFPPPYGEARYGSIAIEPFATQHARLRLMKCSDQ